MARLVLGVQPVAQGIVLMRYVEIELQGIGRDLVATNPYYVELEPEWVPMTNEFSGMDNPNEGVYVDTNTMILVRRYLLPFSRAGEELERSSYDVILERIRVVESNDHPVP